MSKRAVAAGVVLAIVMLAPVVSAAEGVEGVWEFKNQMQARTSTATMTITKNAEGKLEGKWSSQRGESTLSDVTFENGKVKFVQTSDFGGQAMKTTYEGTVEGGKIAGKGQNQWGDFTFDGTLQGEAKKGADVLVGEWQMNVNMPARENIEKLTITKNADGTLAGKWEGRRGESTISDLKFEGGKLTFTRIAKFGDREFTSTFSGVVEGDNIKGVFSSDRGDREANATRITAAKAEEKKPEEGKKAEPKAPAPEGKKPQ
ncbi:MAG: hypothetical protein WAK60_04530 [Sedimentisphaerales bacterium]